MGIPPRRTPSDDAMLRTPLAACLLVSLAAGQDTPTSCDVGPDAQAIERAWASVADKRLRAGATRIELEGLAGEPVELRAARDQALIARTVVDDEGRAVVTLDRPVETDRYYYVNMPRFPGCFEFMRPAIYVGDPDPLAGGAHFVTFRGHDALQASVDNARFDPHLQIHGRSTPYHPDANQAKRTYDVRLVIGTPEQVVEDAGKFVLASPDYLPTVIRFWRDRSNAISGRLRLSLEDHELIGLDLALQWWFFEDENTVKFSDIMIARIAEPLAFEPDKPARAPSPAAHPDGDPQRAKLDRLRRRWNVHLDPGQPERAVRWNRARVDPATASPHEPDAADSPSSDADSGPTQEIEAK